MNGREKEERIDTLIYWQQYDLIQMIIADDYYDNKMIMYNLNQ